MCEIKFRAVISERNAVIYFDLTDLVHPSRKDLFSNRELLVPWLLEGNEPDEFTGLKDKNGKEIYQSDIILHFINSLETERTIVDYVPTSGGFEPFCKKPWWRNTSDDVEVIGNIYENPELMGIKNDQ